MDPVSDPEHVFSNGLYLANLAVSSNILIDSWNAISEFEGDNPATIIKSHPDYNIIAFVSVPVTGYLQEKSGSVHISEIADFQFQCSDTAPSFSENEAAFSRFNSLREKFPELEKLVADSFKREDHLPFVITGCCLDGCISSLFTLWLLDKLNPTKHTHLLCVTFGCPLLGDNTIHQAVSRHPSCNSRFLHVVHKDERRLFLVDPSTGQSPYKPFGTFLLYSESGCACFQAPESVIELLKCESCEDGESQTFDYKSIIECFERMPFPSNGSSFLGHGAAGPSQRQNERTSALTGKIVEHEQNVIRQREEFDPDKELDEMKVYLALMEWYMAKCRAKGQGPGYYDSFKSARERRDNGADKYKTYLTDYWEKVVEEAEKKPPRRGAPLRNRLLFAGNNYRKIVEPLDIAEYYRRGRKDYENRGRSNHYRLLEQWLKKHQERNPPASAGPSQSKVEKVMEDSCFWARVEEAIRSCRRLDRDRAGEEAKLKRFEKDVMDMIGNRKVSPDIFLEKSSYMQWWREYEEILKDVTGGSDSHHSELADYMKAGRYTTYDEKPPTDSNENPSDTSHPVPKTSGDPHGSQLVS